MSKDEGGKMNKKQSKDQNGGIFEIFSPAQIAITVVVVVLVVLGIVNGYKALSPASPPISDTDMAARASAKANNPNLNYTGPPIHISNAQPSASGTTGAAQ
jgi:hypothetical protein